MPEPGFAVPLLLRFATLAVEGLAAAREEIDALNVYPVPDGDTGTNLLLTFEAASTALQEALGDQAHASQPRTGEAFAADAGDVELGSVLTAYSRGLLLGARGNSGVIMSELVGALLRRLAEASAAGDAAPAPVVALARAMAAATEAAYAAVGRPVEGTMLTVARAASDAALAAAEEPAARVAGVLNRSVTAAYDALARTPEQLEVLRRAGVVDAGGRGLCVVLEAAEAAFTGRRGPARRRRRPAAPEQTALGAASAREEREEAAAGTAPDLPESPGDLPADGEGPAYEVMYLLDADESAVTGLRSTLAALGDSLVVVGGEGLWNVHVHVDDVGAAIEAGIAAGRPHRVRVTHFADQGAPWRSRQAAGPTGRRIVVVAFGPGLAKLYAEAGASVLEASVTHRPSTGELLEAILDTSAAEVVVVPNDRDVMPAAEAAVRLAENDHGIRAAVIPTTAQVHGLAAVAVHDPGREFAQDLVEMTAAARHARSGAVTVAARRAITMAGECEPGDVLGAVEGDFVVVGSDRFAVAVEVIERLLGGGGELFTVVAGDGGEELAQRCAEHVEHSHPGIEVLLHSGGQERYPVLFGVE